MYFQDYEPTESDYEDYRKFVNSLKFDYPDDYTSEEKYLRKKTSKRGSKNLQKTS